MIRIEEVKGAAPAESAPRYHRAIDLVDAILAEAALPVIPTGLPGLDFRLGGGLRARSVHVIIGGSGKGKTSLGAQIAARHAESSPVIYYIGEGTPAAFVARIVGQRSGYSWREVLSGGLSAEQMRAVLAPLNLWVIGRCASPVAEIVKAADAALALGAGVPLLVIDYAQIMAELSDNQRLGVQLAMRDILALTEVRDLVTLVLSQGSRASARTMRSGNGAAEEYIDTGAETSDIEKGAVTLISLVYAPQDDAVVHEVTAMIAKQRMGGAHKVGLRYHGVTGRWEDLEGVPLSPKEKETAAIDERVLEAVRSANRAPTRTQLRQGAVPGFREKKVLDAIDRLLTAGRLITRTEPRPNAAGKMRAVEVLAMPDPETCPKVGTARPLSARVTDSETCHVAGHVSPETCPVGEQQKGETCPPVGRGHGSPALLMPESKPARVTPAGPDLDPEVELPPIADGHGPTPAGHTPSNGHRPNGMSPTAWRQLQREARRGEP